MAISEAGLRLRLIRIASTCSLDPQLGAVMQTLLQAEIRAAMHREELALLGCTDRALHDRRRRVERVPVDGCETSPIASNKDIEMISDSVATHTRLDGLRQGKKRVRNDDDDNPMTVKRLRVATEMGGAGVTLPPRSLLSFQPYPSAPNSKSTCTLGSSYPPLYGLACSLPSPPHHARVSFDQDLPYLSDLMDEDEILEKAWMESMTRRASQPDLRKSLLLQSVVESFMRASGRYEPFVTPSTHL
jgi:hypothetical protein